MLLVLFFWHEESLKIFSKSSIFSLSLSLCPICVRVYCSDPGFSTANYKQWGLQVCLGIFEGGNVQLELTRKHLA